MLFVDFKKGDSPQDMYLLECDKPVLRPGQVLLRVRAFGINRADTLQRQGKYPAPIGESLILGLEVAGELVDLGDSSTGNNHWQLGDKVFGLVAGGGYAEYVAVNPSHLMAIPENLNMQQAAGIAEAFLTAYQAMFVLSNLLTKQKVLIHAGASGVGLAAIQLAKVKKCQVAVTSSTKPKLQKCADVGADLLINYQQQDFSSSIRETWQGVDLIIDFVAGDYLNRNLQALNTDGTIVYLAMLAGRFSDQLDMALMLGKRASVKGSTLRNRSEMYKQSLIEGFSQDFLAKFATKELEPVIDTVYQAKDVAIAHQRIEKNDTMGKLVCYW
jgi:putative PIG3 family NAD(P)H quinone oxidoreductase